MPAAAPSGPKRAPAPLAATSRIHYICQVEILDNDIKFVPGVGEARARLLDKELGIRTVGDLLNHFPFRYIDRTRIYRIGEITEGGPSLCLLYTSPSPRDA